jgi:cytoskeletal protein CcmA (bactofilin family)
VPEPRWKKSNAVTNEPDREACLGTKKEMQMFNSKTTANGSNGAANGAANGAKLGGSLALPSSSAAHPVGPRAESTPVSCIGSGMSIVGNVECSGSAQVFGRIEGELRASELVIGEGAQIQGSVIAQEVTVSGTVKGTIRAVRVTLHGGTVEGDIFNRSLSIDENSVFEGASRRDENPTERRRENGTQPSSSAATKAPQNKKVESPSLAPSTLLGMDAAVQEH